MKKNILIVFLTLIVLFSSSAFSKEAIEKLIILGKGPAGLTSAIFAGQADLKPLVVEGNECDSQLEAVYRIENFPGFPEGISGNELIERIHLQAEKFGARFQPGNVVDINLINRPFRLTLNDGQIVYSEAVIIALGTAKRWIGLESEKLLIGKGVSSSATCEAHLFQDQEVVVIGGGDAALEEALALAEYARKITLIHRSNKFNAATYLQDKVFSDGTIQVVWDCSVEEILDVSQGCVTGVVLRNLKTQEKSVLPCNGVFVSIGRQPNTELFKGQLEISPKGLIVVKAPSTQTSIDGVFAAGDAVDLNYRKAITAAAGGCMAAMDAIRFLMEGEQEK